MDRWTRKTVVALGLIAAFLTFGTLFFHYTEGWSYVDSFYFSGITLTTVGYGDFMPTTPLTRIVTVLFAFAGIGIVFYSIGIIAQRYFEREEERLQQIWETARTVRQNAKLRSTMENGLLSKDILIKSAQQDRKRTATIMRKK